LQKAKQTASHPAGYIRNQNIEAAAWRSEEDIQNDDSDDESTTPTKTQTE